MRNLFIILLLSATNLANAQDTCNLSFAVSNGAILDEHKKKVDEFIADRYVEQIEILAHVPKGEAASSNRILTEIRVHSINQMLLEKGYPFNIITSKIDLAKGNPSWNTIQLAFKLGAKKDSKVLKQTPIVQIKEIDIKPSPVGKLEKQERKIDVVKEVQKNEILKIENFKKNEKIRLPDLLFEPGTHFILPSSNRILAELLVILKAKPKLKIELQGHICCKLGGIDGFDPTTGKDNLSEMRAKVVFLYLISKGIAIERMSYKGFGSSRKIYANDMTDRLAAMQNRRVEVLITETD